MRDLHCKCDANYRIDCHLWSGRIANEFSVEQCMRASAKNALSSNIWGHYFTTAKLVFSHERTRGAQRMNNPPISTCLALRRWPTVFALPENVAASDSDKAARLSRRRLVIRYFFDQFLMRPADNFTQFLRRVGHVGP